MRNKYTTLFFFFSSFLLLDQITKVIFTHRDFLFGPLHLHLVKNYGLSFALNFGSVTNLTLVALALVFFCYYFWTHRHEMTALQQIGFVLIFAGAISNAADRIALGYVRDFLNLGLGFTFNFADMFVTFGLIIIFLL